MREAQSPFGEQNGGPLSALQLAPTIRAVGVFQAKAGLVPLGHLGAIERQQIIVGKDLDAVEVSVGTGAEHRTNAWQGARGWPRQPPQNFQQGSTQGLSKLQP